MDTSLFSIKALMELFLLGSIVHMNRHAKRLVQL